MKFKRTKASPGGGVELNRLCSTGGLTLIYFTNQRFTILFSQAERKSSLFKIIKQFYIVKDAVTESFKNNRVLNS